MSIYDIKKEDLKDKYKYLLKYFCYINTDKLCNELSYNKSGCCNNCKHIIKNEMFDLLEQYNIHEKNIINNIQSHLRMHDIMTNKNITETKNVIDIFEIIYYNMFFVIIYPRFLITLSNKIYEIIGTEKDFMISFINKINYKKNIMEFMCDMYNFINNFINISQKNNITIDINISKENFELFLDSYIKFMENHYDINYYKKTYNEKNIDIDDIDNIEIVLEI
jgi:hypothetical protein